jgi:hypothetical protein
MVKRFLFLSLWLLKKPNEQSNRGENGDCHLLDVVNVDVDVKMNVF